MTAKRDGKVASRYKFKKNKSGAWLAGIVLGIAVITTGNNIYTAFRSAAGQLLFNPEIIDLDNFASSKYQPIQIGNSKTIQLQDFTKIDLVAKQLNYSGTSIAELAKLLEKHTNNEGEKARIIYAWITQHITYDLTAYDDVVYRHQYPDVSPERVLRDRSTICSGYSNLYLALAEAMNLESAIIVGYAKGATPQEPRFSQVNHAWNAVKIDSAWYLLDSTWGAGAIVDGSFSPEYKPYYFATAPQEFINHHFPQDSGWQLLSSTYSRTEFDNLPQISDRFYSLGLELLSHHNFQIAVNNRLTLKLKAPPNVTAIAVLQQGEQEFLDSAVLVNRQKDQLIINVAPPAPGTYELGIYAKPQDNTDQYGEVIKYQIQATQASEELPKIYGHFNQQQVGLIEPLDGDLKPNWSTYFNLVVPQATDVQVVNTVTQEWTPLNGYGNYFVGNVDIQPGETVVIAKFPGSDEYWRLIAYQSGE